MIYRVSEGNAIQDVIHVSELQMELHSDLLGVKFQIFFFFALITYRLLFSLSDTVLCWVSLAVEKVQTALISPNDNMAALFPLSVLLSQPECIKRRSVEVRAEGGETPEGVFYTNRLGMSQAGSFYQSHVGWSLHSSGYYSWNRFTWFSHTLQCVHFGSIGFLVKEP